MPQDADYWIERLGLTAHPEGGFFRETYRSAERLDHGLPERYDGPRSLGTAIHFLLKSGQRSALHRMRSDELWFFHAGSPLRVVAISPEGERHDWDLGPDPEAGQAFQAAVPLGWWFGAEVLEADSYALVSCTVHPGFEFADFELGDREVLLDQFPQHAELIQRMAPEPGAGGDESSSGGVHGG